MADLIDGGSWWAMVEERGNPDEVHYWKVIAWERVDDSLISDGGTGVVAWINGRDPIRSDHFTDRVKSWILNQFVPQLPEGAKTNSWA